MYKEIRYDEMMITSNSIDNRANLLIQSSQYILHGTYSVFFFIRLQKRGYCELVFKLLRSPMASMSSQDQAQITFRSETHNNEFYNGSGRRLSQGRIERFVNLSMIVRLFKNWFLLQSTTSYALSLKCCPSMLLERGY